MTDDWSITTNELITAADEVYDIEVLDGGHYRFHRVNKEAWQAEFTRLAEIRRALMDHETDGA